jgi:hypothetical protein
MAIEWLPLLFDIESADQIPVLAEPLFSGMGAHVEFHRVMSFDDLRKAIPQAIVQNGHSLLSIAL